MIRINIPMPKHCAECLFYNETGCILYSLGIPSRYNYNPYFTPDWCELIEEKREISNQSSGRKNEYVLSQ